MIYFTSDTHFGHANVLAFTERPYQSIEQMDSALVTNINKRVGRDDELYVLGDFSFKCSLERAMEIRSQIACKRVHLVPGNHDKNWAYPDARSGMFIVEPELLRLKFEGRKFVLSHYPLADWPGFSHGAIHLHGHIHAPAAYNERNRELRLLRYDVGVDANNCRPVSLAEIFAFFEGVEIRERIPWQEWTGASLR